jgi:5-oxoprolinase (ATP-hydrolysing) subunit C
MTDAVLSVLFAGPHVTVQDAGRPGFLRFGVPWSGPMDRRSFVAANVALGNPAGSPAIEVSLGGLSLECLSGTVSFAVAGGGFILDHAGAKRGSWTVATLRAGERLGIRPGPWGSWCYLAFAGTLRTEHWLGSASTHALSGLGGGRVSTGISLTIADAVQRDGRLGDFPCPVTARPRSDARITIGPQDRFFSPDTLATFLNGPWWMTDAFDRMGARLSGPLVAPDAALDMPSEPILRGSVQVAGDGVASILLADHQTTGGYPKIATVLDCDTDSLAQLRPRDPLRFTPVSPRQAIDIARSAARADQRHREGLTRRFGPVP